MTNIAQMVNVLQSMILTDSGKMVLTPTYHVYKMYLPFQDATFLPVKMDAGQYTLGTTTLPKVDAIAARGKDGKVWLSLTNLDPNKSALFTADIAGVTAKAALGETLTADKIDSVNSFEAPNAVVPKPFSAKPQGGTLVLTLAPHSVTVVQLQP